MKLWVAIALFFAAVQAAPARADALGDVQAQQLEVTRLDGERAQLDGRRVRLEHESQELAAEIEREKAEAPGVRRDFRLQELLAASQAKTSELERVASDLRARTQSLTGARRTLMSSCDRALGGSLPEARRLELARLRTAQVTLLAMPQQPLGIGKPVPAPAYDPLDGPRELAEKADLLRDSGDKLRREVTRIASRIDDVERRRHLRERAGAVDEDWFGESTSNRHVARSSTSHGTDTAGKASDANPQTPGAGVAGPPTGGGAGSATPSPAGGGTTNGGGTPPVSNFANDPANRGSDSTVLRNLVDPATLDELRRADGSDDLERQVRALRRAQGELQGLANDLERRAKGLSSRANELKHQK